jgi:hypothetical protein
MVVSDVALGNEIISNLNEGVVWYTGMQESVDKLKAMCSDWTMSRGIEKEELDDSLRKSENVRLFTSGGRHPDYNMDGLYSNL